MIIPITVVYKYKHCHCCQWLARFILSSFVTDFAIKLIITTRKQSKELVILSLIVTILQALQIHHSTVQ